ncbi:SLATT domain-containing protein [Pseudoxanthomonas suwonensis]|uniref:SLATT domain-containing protein n=1 Tax=Pseudoxanthomonas suwonensis TaxID=314722 RepID=UPI00138F746C|nr:SLATT domain-containing protein [Pseudoxanthomonas suwonensis]KAF1701681.1 hypothetical protein CSC68_08550 [Pseudoxanthomonas suwonensis]
MNDAARVLEGQIRECYGRVVYTHKTHEKCADLLLERHKRIKLLQIILSALVTGGILTTLSDEWDLWATGISAVLSTALLALNSYTKDYDLGEIAQKHRRAAADIWLVREKYLSLLSDLRSSSSALGDVRIVRDSLLSDLHAIYTGAPSTNYKAYREAQRALQSLEDMTFSEAEIDAFLPRDLKRGS